jgi:hypothetical protein
MSSDNSIALHFFLVGIAASEPIIIFCAVFASMNKANVLTWTQDLVFIWVWETCKHRNDCYEYVLHTQTLETGGLVLHTQRPPNSICRISVRVREAKRKHGPASLPCFFRRN